MGRMGLSANFCDHNYNHVVHNLTDDHNHNYVARNLTACNSAACNSLDLEASACNYEVRNSAARKPAASVSGLNLKS